MVIILISAMTTNLTAIFFPKLIVFLVNFNVLGVQMNNNHNRVIFKLNKLNTRYYHMRRKLL